MLFVKIFLCKEAGRFVKAKNADPFKKRLHSLKCKLDRRDPLEGPRDPSVWTDPVN